jgi:hypothetical protein
MARSRSSTAVEWPQMAITRSRSSACRCRGTGARLHWRTVGTAPSSPGLTAPVAIKDRSAARVAVAAKVVVEFVAVVGAVSDKFFREPFYESRGERVVDKLRFMALTARSPHGDRNTMTVCHCHDLGRFAAASDSNLKTPLFAPAWVPSINASVRSISPRS